MLKNLFHHKKPFIGFVTAGDGGIDYCVECCLQLITGGVDALELGLAFSDPVADGPVIQQSSQRALENGMTPETVLEIAKRIRQHTSVPLILFTYYNPLLQYGDIYLNRAKQAGFDAVLVVDFAPTLHQQNSVTIFSMIKAQGMTPILLTSPSSSDARLNLIASHAEGFIYYACQKGTTGEKHHLPNDFEDNITRIKNVSSLPIVAGFGIADKASAKQALHYADGFVVGSAFVKLMAKKASPSALADLARQIDPRE